MNRFILAFAMTPCLVAPTLAGEEAPRTASAPVRYVRERALDLLDIVEVNVGVGRGAKVSVAYGIQLFGLGSVRSWRAGTIDRRAGTWREIDTEFAILPLSLAAWPVHYGAMAVGARGLAADAKFIAQAGSEGVEHLDRKELGGDPAWIVKDTVSGPVHTRWADTFPIGAEVHAGVGLRARVRPLEIIDFVLGFVGVEMDPWLERNPDR